MKQLQIVVDQDDVLADWGGRIIEWWNEDMLKKDPSYKTLSRDEVDTWSFEETLGPESGIYIRAYIRYPNFYQDLDPLPDAVHGMKELISMGHDVVIASAVPKQAGLAYEGKLNWLRRWMPFFDLDQFFACKQKWRLGGEILLDDGVHNLRPWKSRGKIAVAYPQPCNKDWDGPRVTGWNDFLEKIEKYRSRNDAFDSF